LKYHALLDHSYNYLKIEVNDEVKIEVNDEVSIMQTIISLKCIVSTNLNLL